MLDELDFTKEAANQETFRTFLKDSGIDHEVTAPKVFPEASTKRVLTMVRYPVGILTPKYPFWQRPPLHFLSTDFSNSILLSPQQRECHYETRLF